MTNDQKFTNLVALAVVATGCATTSMKKEPIKSDWIEREPFDSAVASVNGSNIEIELSVKRDGQISPWFSLGRFGKGSVKSTPRDGISVELDVLRVAPPLATAFQYRLSVPASFVRIVTYRHGDRKPFAANHSIAWGKVLHVPQRSQVVEAPEVRGKICSPTCVAMVLEYYGINLPTAEVCQGVYDASVGIYGNWPFNTAYAMQVGREKLAEAYVGRFSSVEELENEIIAGRPVVISLRWKKGELTEAVVGSSDGHLLVVVGFTGNGDVVVNDPAANPDKAESIRRIYLRRDIYRCWLENAEGIVYLFRPKS